MSANKKTTNSITSMLPVVAIGLAVIFLMDYFVEPDEEKKVVDSVSPTSTTSSPKTEASKLNDFLFEKEGASASDETIPVDTGPFYVELSKRGGKINKFYMKSYGELELPKEIIKESDDPVAKKLHALEVSRYNGMDFQPHIYWYNKDLKTFWQIDNPPLNSGKYTAKIVPAASDSLLQQIEFSLPVEFKGHKLELIKIFRFFKDENFFRQITVIRNLENKPFVLNGSLYYKTFGDLGPLQEAQDLRHPATRFYHYGDELFQKGAVPGAPAAGCSGGCDSKNKDKIVIDDHLDSLQFVGSTSRYFFGYSKFMFPANEPQQTPDGLILVDKYDPTGSETGTVFYKNFQLQPGVDSPLDLGDTRGNTDAAGKFVSADKGNFYRIVSTQKERKDALVIDSMVYLGVRSDEAHSFNNEKLMEAEFGMTEPDGEARRALFSFGYFSYFSKIKDAIVWLMRVIYRITGNYGWSIIIIAIAAKLLTFPLNQMQVKSMKKMSALKPEIDKINVQYAKDPQEKQKQIMEMYRKHNVNPAKGCLPMFVQMPIFIALFSAFSESVELWQSPFIWWMTDLSMPDTIYVVEDLFFVQNLSLNILPVFMVISQIFYQKFNTVTADPQQKVLMYIMPIVFAFMFWSMPSGVTLYWTVQNVFSIVWQIAANKLTSDD